MDNKSSETQNQGHVSGIKIDKLIEKYGAEKQSKGLANLLNLGDPAETVGVPSSDPMILNEILRAVRERQSSMEGRFDELENQLQLTRKFHNKDKRFLVGLVCATLLTGLLLGNLLSNPEKVEAPVVVKAEKAPVKVSKKLMVTNKFVNMRAKNSPKAQKLLTVSPAQTVEVLGKKGGWVHVNYHNKLTGKTYNGYVWDEFLTDIK